MNCQRFESIASELARNQIMEADVRGEALRTARSVSIAWHAYEMKKC